MANCLLTWELGEGLGHATVLRPMVEALLEHGHTVFAAMRDIIKSRRAFARLPVVYLPAPFHLAPGTQVDRPRTFAHVLANVGFAKTDELSTLVSAWQHLYDLIQPDLLIFDHSPMAMVAARGRRIRKVVVGTGFEIPPDQYPLPAFSSDSEPLSQQDTCHENKILDHINAVLIKLGVEPLTQISSLFTGCDATILATFAEMDHYSVRKSAEYWGCWPNQGGAPPRWPAGNRLKTYAYLKPFPNIIRLLEMLRDKRLPSLVCFDGPAERISRYFTSDIVQVTDRPFDLAEIGRTCDLAIVTGSHGATASLLLSGKPLLLLPNHTEQAITARNVACLGAGLVANPKEFEHVQSQFSELLSRRPEFERAARRFAQKYAAFDADNQKRRAASIVLKLLAN